MKNTDTICAIATGKSRGAISIIRLSGDDAFRIIDEIFVGKSKQKLTKQKTQSLHFGSIYKDDLLLDEVLISIFKAPKSYTGENLVEISCHASTYIQESILQILIKKGARIANAGEFTFRAYQNGKLDLSQAEAVADLIASQSQLAHQVAMNQMRGGISNQLKELRQQLLNFISLIELELDFSEEDVEFANREDLKDLIEKIHRIIAQLIHSFEKGNAIKNGVPIAIIGEPNVGKSTLLNAILNDEKAIVSEIAGTTRDVVEDVFNFNGIYYRFFDTAGLRDTKDVIENLGIERTYKKIEQASVVLLMVNADDNVEKINFNVKKILKKTKKNQSIILVINKIDLSEKYFNYANKEIADHIFISAKKKKNINELLQKIEIATNLKNIPQEETIITNIRHLEGLNLAQEAIERVLEGLEQQITSDFLSMDIREAIFHLSGITGEEITTDEVLGNIFKNFCIGK